MITTVKFLSYEITRHMHILGSRFTAVRRLLLHNMVCYDYFKICQFISWISQLGSYLKCYINRQIQICVFAVNIILFLD